MTKEIKLRRFYDINGNPLMKKDVLLKGEMDPSFVRIFLEGPHDFILNNSKYEKVDDHWKQTDERSDPCWIGSIRDITYRLTKE